MVISLKLSHKGLLLVTVPLLFELVFVIFLFALLERAEMMVEKEARSREIISTANDMSKDLFDCAYALVGWNYTKGDMFRKQFEQCYKSIPQGMDNLKRLSKGSKRELAHLEKLEKISATVLAELDDQRHNIENSTNIYGMDFGAYRRKLGEVFAPFISELKDLSREEKLIQEKAPRATRESRSQLRQYLVLGVALNILLALWLASFFSREVSKRLGIMMDNAERFARGKELGSPVGGSDEVAQLDRVFHKMAEALLFADQQKREFVNMISHDLRTPLNSIQGTLELLVRGSYGELNERGKRRVADAEQETDRLLCLINELLDIEKLEAGMLDLSFSKTDLASIISRSVNAVNGLAESKEVKIETPPVEIQLSCDADRVVQVLVNLLSNALKYSPQGKTVSITVAEKDGMLELRVSDQGPGIPAEAREKIFDRFQQLKESGDAPAGGSGLGLAICRALVQGHHGEIGVESQVDHGSTFWFTLPIEQNL